MSFGQRRRCSETQAGPCWIWRLWQAADVLPLKCACDWPTGEGGWGMSHALQIEKPTRTGREPRDCVTGGEREGCVFELVRCNDVA